MNVAAVPEELKALPQWVTWQVGIRDGRPTKIPLNPKTGGPGKSNDPATWGTFDQALSHYQAHQGNGIAGIGFVFSVNDRFCGIDLDKCRDPETGQLNFCAQSLITFLNTYHEVSPSGTGIHAIAACNWPVKAGNSKALPCGMKIEIFDRLRYFTITGHRLPGGPTKIEDRQNELMTLHRELFTKPRNTPRAASGPSPTLDLDDAELIDRAHKAANGCKFSQLWRGDTSGYPSPSEADFALCEMLAFWTGGDPARIERLFSQSGLGQRDKWRQRPDYRERTIQEALAQTTNFYTPGKGKGPKPEGGQKRNGSQERLEGGNGQTQGKEKTSGSGSRQGGGKSGPQIRLVTAAELECIEFKEPKWIVPEILPEGLDLLSSRPKKGKTWWGLNISVAKATGGCALGRAHLRLEPGKVLYLALEDKLRRAKQRLRIIMGNDPFPEELILTDTWPRLDQGGLEALSTFLKEHNDCRLVIIDSFAKIKPVRPKNADAYEFEMAWGGALQSLAQERQVCILLIYHNRKSEGEDPIDDVMGSTSLTAAVDAVLILRRGRGEADGTLLVTGRDVEEQELAMKFHPAEGLWELLGTAAECAISQQRKEILAVLKETGPQTVAQLVKILGKNYDTVRVTIGRMREAGLVRLREDGKYEVT
jgi:DNA-binding transcriptional ArsR family regulator